MLLRYVLLLIVFHIVYSKHVLNKVPVRVPKPVKISKGSSSNINKIAGSGSKDKLNVLDEKGSLGSKEDKEQLEEPGASDGAPAGNNDDNKNTENKDVGDDGEKEVLSNNDETETIPSLRDANQEDGDGEKQPSDDGEKEVPAENVNGNADDDKKDAPAENVDDGEKEVAAEIVDAGTPDDGVGEEKGAPKKNDDNKDADDNAKLKKPRKKEPLFDDNLLDRYHPEKVSFMQDDISASWPLGIIPYHLDTSSFDDILAARIRDAMDLLEHSSCLQFRALSGRKPDNLTWIHITNPWRQRECSHKPKRKSSGEIVLILGLDCLKQRDLLHSLLHGIGFNDEVTHPHRDQYIRIMWENIQPVYQRLFGVIPRHKKLLTEYDPMSIMHFHDRAFSKNGQATISVMMPGLQIQPSDKLSQLDKLRLRLAFGHECNRRTVDKIFDTCKTVLRKNQDGEDGNNKLKRKKTVTEEP